MKYKYMSYAAFLSLQALERLQIMFYFILCLYIKRCGITNGSPGWLIYIPAGSIVFELVIPALLSFIVLFIFCKDYYY